MSVCLPLVFHIPYMMRLPLLHYTHTHTSRQERIHHEQWKLALSQKMAKDQKELQQRDQQIIEVQSMQCV